jgi:hypothetical protein
MIASAGTRNKTGVRQRKSSSIVMVSRYM